MNSGKKRLKRERVMGYLLPMNAIRVPTARFKYNMKPYVDRAKGGETVIVTKGGEDDFKIVPCARVGPPPVSSTPLDPKDYEGIDVDEPAFESWGKDESAP